MLREQIRPHWLPRAPTNKPKLSKSGVPVFPRTTRLAGKKPTAARSDSPLWLLLCNRDPRLTPGCQERRVGQGCCNPGQSLSSEHVLSMDKTEALPQGGWAIVVMRPLEHLLFHKNTAASVVITAF